MPMGGMSDIPGLREPRGGSDRSGGSSETISVYYSA